MAKEVINKVLIVDDEPGLLESTALLLKRAGYDVTPCCNAREALAKVREHNIDVVLSDIKMPEVSGIGLLEEIHKINAGLPVILMTAYAELDAAVDALKKGAFDFLIKPTPPDYLLHSMKRAFQHINLLKLKENYKLYLEDMVGERTQSLASEINERIRTENSLRLSEKQLREMASRLQKAEETERKDLARELHDRVGQNLSALNINLGIIRGMVHSCPKDEILSRIDDSMELVEEIGSQIRDVMNDLRPDLLDEYGLASALRWYGERFSKRTGLPVTVNADEHAPRLPEEAESTLFLISKEALNNIARHAEAKMAVLTIEIKEGLAHLTIRDDGKGFVDTSSVQKEGREPGWGLHIMQERAQSIGGSFHIDSGQGKGTKITVEVKIKQHGD